MSITPVLCGSSFKNKGVQPLLDAVIDYLPSPLDVPPDQGHGAGQGGDEVEAERHADDTEPFAALAFKIMADPYVGKLTYFRVYSGKLEAGSRVLNANTGRTERIGRILMMHANDREDVTEVYAGDIAAGVGIKQVFTGDTLAAPDKPIRLETMDVPGAGDLRRDRAEDEVRPGEDVGRARPPGRGGPDLPGRAPTRRPARPRSPAWASCTSRCWSTACCASSRSRPTSAARRSPTARR